MSRYDADSEVINPAQFTGNLRGGPGHGSQSKIPGEQALVSNLTECFPGTGDLTPLLQFHQLVKTTRPGSIGEAATRVFVNDLDLSVTDEIVDVAMIQMQCAKRLRQQSISRPVCFPGAALRGCYGLDPFLAGVGQFRLTGAVIDPVVLPDLQTSRNVQCLGLGIDQAMRFDFARKYERRTSFVNEHAVGFVDDRKTKTA